jgi:hypothetical protein
MVSLDKLGSALASFLRLSLALALGFLLAFLLHRGLTLEVPEWEDETPTALHWEPT